jgi:hypothetical protein
MAYHNAREDYEKAYQLDKTLTVAKKYLEEIRLFWDDAALILEKSVFLFFIFFLFRI